MDVLQESLQGVFDKQLASSGKASIKSISLISLLFIETKVLTKCAILLPKLIFR